jgi:hypothetical protein
VLLDGATLSRIAPSRRPAKAIERYVRRLSLTGDVSSTVAAGSDFADAGEAVVATTVVVAISVVELVQAASTSAVATVAIAPDLRIAA